MSSTSSAFLVATLTAMAICSILRDDVESLSPDEAHAFAKEAYIYGFPIVDSYRIQYSYFVDKDNPEYKGGWNEVHSTQRLYVPGQKQIHSANPDTRYSLLGADLRAEPIVISAPAVENGRRYSIQFIDMYTRNFANLADSATANRAGSYLLAGSRWTGDKPEGVKDVIRSETEFVFVIFQTQLFNSEDAENVKKIQASYKVQTLSQFLGNPAPAATAASNFIKPLGAEDQRSSLAFFNVLNFVLQFCHTCSLETERMARFAKLNIGAGKIFSANALRPEIREAAINGMLDGELQRTRSENGTIQ
jgi:hypothetical protein